MNIFDARPLFIVLDSV